MKTTQLMISIDIFYDKFKKRNILLKNQSTLDSLGWKIGDVISIREYGFLKAKITGCSDATVCHKDDKIVLDTVVRHYALEAIKD